ncbi:hypothetical protein HDV01_004158 [Terramyces sp. JEL0728]|nr:hypothetical protein HDV01_004158 [Terramyces sp. JEL0728]
MTPSGSNDTGQLIKEIDPPKILPDSEFRATVTSRKVEKSYIRLYCITKKTHRTLRITIIDPNTNVDDLPKKSDKIKIINVVEAQLKEDIIYISTSKANIIFDVDESKQPAAKTVVLPNITKNDDIHIPDGKTNVKENNLEADESKLPKLPTIETKIAAAEEAKHQHNQRKQNTNKATARPKNSKEKRAKMVDEIEKDFDLILKEINNGGKDSSKWEASNQLMQAKLVRETIRNKIEILKARQMMKDLGYKNTDYDTAMQDQYLGTTLTSQGRLLTNYKAVAHPSQPNYVAMIGGSTFGVNSDGTFNVNQKSVVDLLTAGGKTWGAYEENYPGNCFSGDSSPYRRKHNPFISYTTVAKNSGRCSKIAPATQLATDIKNKSVPDYVFYTPNMNNDGHDTSVGYASNWLQTTIGPLFTNPYFANTLFLVTFDEDASYTTNQVYAILLGGGVTPGSTDNTAYTHYSQLATVEMLFNLGNLGQNDAKAAPFKIQ